MSDDDDQGHGKVKVVVKGTVGTVYEFNLKDDWSNWNERLSLYFLANDIEDSKKVPILLTTIGTEGYSLLKDLCTPDLPSTKSYNDLIKLMSDHLQPKPSEITERYKFKERHQREGESVIQYIANLKKLSVNCGFGTNLESALRDQIVWGLKNMGIKKRLLSEPDLTYKRCVELAISLESAIREVAELNAGNNAAVNEVRKSHHASGNLQPRPGPSSRKPDTYQPQRPTKHCYCCGKPNHVSLNCYYRTYKCNSCGKQGHLKKVCKANFKNVKPGVKQGHNSRVRPNQNFVGDSQAGKSSSSKPDENDSLVNALDCLDMSSNMYSLQSPCSQSQSIGYVKPIKLELFVENKPINFEVDTGSGITAMGQEDFISLFPNLKLQPTDEMFHSYVGDPIKPIGVVDVNCAISNNSNLKKCLRLYVMRSSRPSSISAPPIVGRSWLQELQVNLGQLNSLMNTGIKTVNSVDFSKVELDKVLNDYPSVFSDKLGLYNKRKFELHLKEGAQPIFFKPRPIPYAIRDKVDCEIDRLVREKILSPVESSEYGTPIVPVIKPDGSIRLCGDYKVTINKMLQIDRHPIPRVDDLFVALRGGKKFSKLDLSQAYQQIELEDKSKDLVTISTHKGLFRYNRLPYGVASGPGLFQREIENLLRGLDHTVCFLDDIVVTGVNDEEHLKNLRIVLARLSSSGLTVKKSKCSFFQDKVCFLGHIIDAQGLHMTQDKVKAIVEAKPPTNITELQAYLGLVNYYAKFLPDLSTVLSPLYELLRKSVKFNWSCRQDEAFRKSKELLSSGKVLVHFDPELELVLACDASPQGLGSVLSHRYSNGDEKPIAYASRSLTKAEKGYSQLEKEALAIIFSVKHFHQFLYGKHFILKTDHKPLTTIFGPKHGIPIMTANRLQRWAIFLTGYDYEIHYVRSKDNCNADGLSRLPIPCKQIEGDKEEYTYLNFVKDNIPCLNFFDVKKETAKDVILSQVCEYTKSEWPIGSQISDRLKPYHNRRHELYVDRDCLMLGNRVVVPFSLRKLILTELHSSHLGVVKMKAIARSYVWWPKLDADIEEIAKSCTLCLQSKANPPKIISSWKWPAAPGHRIHIDHLGPIQGKMYLLITDAYSKWIDVMEASSLRSDCTIDLLRTYFANWGIPLILVSDNATCFTSNEFQNFVQRNGITHLRTAPFHPASNGAAENSVQTFKSKIEVLSKEMPIKQAVSKFLLEYRNAPHCTTGVSPAELHLGRKLSTRLDRLKPSVTLAQKVVNTQEKQLFCPRNRYNVKFSIGDVVFVKSYSANNQSWVRANIIEQVSPVTFLVKTYNGLVWKRHSNQIITCSQTLNESKTVDNVDLEELLKVDTKTTKPDLEIGLNKSSTPKNIIQSKSPQFSRNVSPQHPKSSVSQEPQVLEKQTTPLRRSSRVRKPTKIFDV